MLNAGEIRGIISVLSKAVMIEAIIQKIVSGEIKTC
jgi:hypothetical protein